MANTFNVSSLVSKSVVAPLHAEGKLINTCGTEYKKDFIQKTYTPGTTIKIDKGPQLQVTQGRVANVQDIEHASQDVTILQYNEAISATSIEKSYSMDSEEDMLRLGRDMGRRMLREVERTGFEAIAKAVGQFVGSVGVEPGALRLFGQGAAFLDNSLAPSADRYAAISPLGQVELIDSLKNANNPTASISNQYLKGSMKEAMNLNFYSSPSVYRATLGTATNATPLINGAISANNTSTIAIDGLSSATATILAGTKFTIGVVGTATAVYAVDPETKAQLPYLRQFTVVSNATGSGSAIAALQISPAIYGPTSQHQNVSQFPTDNAEIVLQLGSITAGSSYTQNVIYQKDAVQLIAVPLKAEDDQKMVNYNGLPVRVGMGAWDAVNDNRILRVDAVWAWVVTRPDHCAVVLGA
jgi:hypothetical protein